MEKVHVFSQLEYHKQYDEYSKIVLKDDALIHDCMVVKELASSVDALKTLMAFSNSLRIIDDQLNGLINSGYVLLKIDTEKRSIAHQVYGNLESAIAEKDYIQLEKDTINDPRLVVALVSSAAVGGIKEAYPNYFADSEQFLKLLNIIENVRGPNQRGLFERILGV